MTKETLILGTSSLDLEHAAHILKNGGLVAFPTETVYGLGALALDPLAIRKIYAAKGRPSYNPLIVHIENISDAYKLLDFEAGLNAHICRERFELLAKAFWPGPLSIIGYKSDLVPVEATAGLAKVALRFPKNQVAQELIRLVGQPLVAPSANLSCRPSPTCAQHVLYTLDGLIDAVIDGGSCDVGLESSVVDITGERPRLLRPGGISQENLRLVLPDLVSEQSHNNDHGAREASPGLMSKHYAPQIGSIEVGDYADLALAWTQTIALLVREGTFAALQANLGPRPLSCHVQILPDDPEGFGQQLYSALYALERLNPKKLLVEALPVAHVDLLDPWQAARDRLLRACSSCELA